MKNRQWILAAGALVLLVPAAGLAQQVAAGKASINGLSIADKDATIETGRKLLGFRVDRTVEAIRAAIGGGETGN